MAMPPPCNGHAIAARWAGEGAHTWRRHDDPAPTVRFEWRAEGAEEAYKQVGPLRYVSPPPLANAA